MRRAEAAEPAPAVQAGSAGGGLGAADEPLAPAAAVLAVHGHFYQPAREDPFSGEVPPDPGAAPWPDWNARVTNDAYAPNAATGNFRHMGWDLGPTIARWLRRHHGALHDEIATQSDGRNAMAQGYHHAILPLASARDRRTEIRWGLRDVELRLGARPSGLWLPETAVDRLTLQMCAEEGVRWTILAPWQAEGRVDVRRAHRLELGSGLRVLVAFYDADLSAAVSFDPRATSDADRFAAELVAPQLASGGLALVATDGELYGHHQPFRDLFLQRLLTSAAGHHGLEVSSPGAWIAGVRGEEAPTFTLHERTAWSCHHGISRWAAECGCAHDGGWKAPLRAAFDRLAGAIDALTEARLTDLGVDAWAARDRFVDVASGYAEPEPWAAGELDAVGQTSDPAGRALLLGLMRAQSSRLAMFASDGWYWEDPRRSETAQVLRFAAHAVRLVDGACGSRLERLLVADLAAVRAPRGGPDGADLYRAALDAVGQPPPG